MKSDLTPCCRRRDLFGGMTTGGFPAEVDQCIFWPGGLAGYLQNSEEAEARRCQKTLTRLDFVVFEGGKSAGGLPARASTPAGTGPARPAAAPPTAVRPDWASISPEFSAVLQVPADAGKEASWPAAGAGERPARPAAAPPPRRPFGQIGLVFPRNFRPFFGAFSRLLADRADR